MSIVHPGSRPSGQHVREAAGQALGVGAASIARAKADAELKDYAAAKAQIRRQKAAEGRPEQLTAASDAMRSAGTASALDKAFAAAVRSLRRRI